MVFFQKYLVFDFWVFFSSFIDFVSLYLLHSTFRNAVPPIRFFRRWVGLDPVPIVKKLDKTESHFEKIRKDHKENIEGLHEKLEKLQQQQSEG